MAKPGSETEPRWRKGVAQATLLLAISLAACSGGKTSRTPEVGPKSKPSISTRRDENLRLVFVGDVMLDNGPGHLISSGKDPFFESRELLLNADFTIANLECVVGRGGRQTLKPFVFRAADQAVAAIQPYFDAVSLANNHTFDFGEAGLLESLAVLRKGNVPYFGAGPTLAEARRPLIIELKGRRIGFFGYNEFYAEDYAATAERAGNVPLVSEAVVADIARAKKDDHCDLVIIFVHWGEELEARPRPDQGEMARRWIDAGASAIVGSHPHVVQTTEVYRGAPIVYSLGNFVFDYYPNDPPEWLGWILTLDIDPKNQISFETTDVVLDGVGVPHPKY